MRTTKRGYLWSDAWLLTAIYGASLGGEPTLARVIGTGDYINHAIFTLSELNGGLSRLERGGFISIVDEIYTLTTLGRDATVADPEAKGGVVNQMATVRDRLGAAPWGPRTNPNDAADPENPKVYVTEDMFQNAFKAYRDVLKKRPKSRKANQTSEVTARKLAEPQG
jgi:hypothetical protein